MAYLEPHGLKWLSGNDKLLPSHRDVPRREAIAQGIGGLGYWWLNHISLEEILGTMTNT